MAKKRANQKSAKKSTKSNAQAAKNDDVAALSAATAKVKKSSTAAKPKSGPTPDGTKKSGKAASGGGDGMVVTLTHDQIARRAFEIWVAKGRPIGQDDQNWREAEAQLHQEAIV